MADPFDEFRESQRVRLCCKCRSSAPRNPVLLQELYLRFASRKEMLLHYGTSEISEALLRWCEETARTEEEVNALLTQEHEKFDLLTTSDLPSSMAARSQPPFGYRMKNGHRVPSIVESTVIRDIFAMYIQGNSLGRIVEWLNLRRVPTRRAGRWQRSTVRYILRNPLYAGYERRGRMVRKSTGDALVDMHTFRVAQSLLSRRCRRPDQRAADMPLDAH